MEFDEWWEKNKARFWEKIDPFKPLAGVEAVAREAWKAGQRKKALKVVSAGRDSNAD